MYQSTETSIDVFEDLSVVLTGFSKADLAGTGLLEIYFKTVNEKLDTETVDGLLSAFQKNKIVDPENLTEKELRDIHILVSEQPYKGASHFC